MARVIILSRFPLQTKPASGNSKVCKSCPEKGLQPLESFNKSPHTKDRRLGVCRACEARKRAEKEAERKLYAGF